MDLQLRGYAKMNDEETRIEISKWVEEIKSVYGTATVLWHPHVLSSDYGWGGNFADLVEQIP